MHCNYSFLWYWLASDTPFLRYYLSSRQVALSILSRLSNYSLEMPHTCFWYLLTVRRHIPLPLDVPWVTTGISFDWPRMDNVLPSLEASPWNPHVSQYLQEGCKKPSSCCVRLFPRVPSTGFHMPANSPSICALL